MTPRDKIPIKQKSVEKLSELKEEHDLCDIWRIRNPTNLFFTFKQNQFSGIINRRLNYIFTSNKLQEFSNDTDIIPAFSTSLNNELKRELLKYEMRRFTISYCKQRTRKDERERKCLENKLKNVLENDDNLGRYHNIN